jgi:pyruvate, orthophosphate dikinase
MMGLRGIRLGITMPEITQMQVRAIFEAACNKARKGIDVHPEIMIPLTGHYNELKVANDLLVPVARRSWRKGHPGRLQVRHDDRDPAGSRHRRRVAEYAEFFSFGTNDLTQMTFGYSRDDAERNFLLYYVEHGILPEQPLPDPRSRGRGRVGQDGRQKRAARRGPSWRSASVASTEVIPAPSSSATSPGSTM